MFAFTVAFALFIVFGIDDARSPGFFYLLFIPVCWAAVRLGVGGAATACVTVQLVLVLTLDLLDYPPQEFRPFQVMMLALTGTGLDDSTLNPATVSITGAAFDLASATHAATAAFAKVRVGQQLTLGVTNTLRLAGATAYQDDLAVTATSGSAKVTAAAPANIFAAASGDVTLTAASAGSLASTLSLGFSSTGKVAGTAITGLSAAALTGGTVTVTGEAYDIADASVASSLTLGGVRVGSTANLAVTNAVRTAAAYQDNLRVAATSADTDVLTVASPTDIAAGATDHGVDAAIEPEGEGVDQLLDVGKCKADIEGFADVGFAVVVGVF